MATLIQHPNKRKLSFSFALTATLLLASCNDGRMAPVKKVPVSINRSLPGQSVTDVVELRPDGQDFIPSNIVAQGNSIFFTGNRVGGMRIDVGADPENPQQIFRLGNQTNNFINRWVYPWYANGGLAVFGTKMFTSGEVGTSVFDFSGTSTVYERQRYQPYDPQNPNDVKADAAFIWVSGAMAPSGSNLHVFRRADYALKYQISGFQMNLAGKMMYGEAVGETCCVNNVVRFGNSLVVTMRGKLVIWKYGPGDSLVNGREFEGIDAQWAAVSSDKLFVMNSPQYGSPYPEGIYVFDRKGKNVGYLTANPTMFAVNARGTHIYGIYPGVGAIRVSRILGLD